MIMHFNLRDHARMPMNFLKRARGTIVDIVLDSREPILTARDENVLVRLDRTKISHLSGLGDQVIPIEPMMVSMELTVPRYLFNGPSTYYHDHQIKFEPLAASGTFNIQHRLGIILQLIDKVILRFQQSLRNFSRVGSQPLDLQFQIAYFLSCIPKFAPQLLVFILKLSETRAGISF
jgi:hypothetical protein